MNVLVVGGTGALGARVVRLLVRAGHDVRGTARTGAGREAVTAAGAAPVDVDLYESGALRGAVAGCQAVLRLSTKIPPLLQMRRADAWRETGRLRNDGASLLVDACIAEGVATYLHESISFLYADGGDRWLDEDAPIDVTTAVPLRDAYTGEAHAHRFSEHGGRGIVLRFAGFYAADSPQALTMAEMARRRRLALVGRSNNYFSAVHLDDAAGATVAALAAPAGVYNVADSEPLRLTEYMSCVAAAAGATRLRRLPGIFGRPALGITWRYLRRSQRVSAQRLRTATGWSPAVPDARAGWSAIAHEWRKAAVTDSKGSAA